MKGVKEKIKTFVNRHKTKIIVGVMLVATGGNNKVCLQKSIFGRTCEWSCGRLPWNHQLV